MSWTANEVKIQAVDGGHGYEEVQLWYVSFAPRTYYPTKEIAEHVARTYYPEQIAAINATPQAVVYYHTFTI